MRKILIAAVLLSATAYAQPRGWTLGDCIQYALDHNISVKQSELNVQQKEIAVSTAEGRRLPGVSAGSSQNFSFGRGLTADNTYANTNTTATSFSIGAEVPVFQGFDISNGIKLSKLELAAATADLDKARDDIRVAVAQAYVQILYCKELLQVARGQVDIDAQQLSRITALMESGKASQAEVSAQQATLARSRLSETQASNNLSLALLDLSQLLELESPEGFDIVSPAPGSLEPALLMNPEDIYYEAVENKPSVLSEKLRLDYAATAIERAKGAFLPSLSLSGGLGSNYYTASGTPSMTFGDQIRNNFSQYLGLSLSVPIFSRFATRNQVKTARLSFESQELQLENVKKSLYKEIQQAYYNAVAAQSKCVSSGEAAASASQAFELTREKYENGKANITEYNESKNRWMEAESDLLQARYECLYQTKLLDFYRGRDLEF